MVPVIPADKANHSFYGGLVCAIVTCVLLTADMVIDTFAPDLKAWRITPFHAALAGFAAACLVGVAKEKYDGWKNKRAGQPVATVDKMDAIWTGIGGLIVSGPRFVAWALGW